MIAHRSAPLVATAALALLTACATSPSVPAPAAAPAVAPPAEPDPRAERLARAEAAFARRAEPGQAQRAVDLLLEAAALQDGPAVRIALARAEHFLGSEAQGEARRAHFGRGAEHALRALEPAGDSPSDECAAARASTLAEPLFWRAANLEGLARTEGIVAGVDSRTRALCLAERAVELDPGLFHAGPQRLLGRLLASLPALAGGDLARSRAAFEAAIAAAPGFLGNRVDFAGFYAVKAQDRAGFEAALQAVETAADATAELAPENALARRRARELRDRVPALF